MKMGMLFGLAQSDANLATAFVFERASRGDKASSQMMGILADKIMQTQGTEEAARWAHNLEPGALRGNAMGRIAHQYAQIDPKAASEWARSVADDANGGHAIGSREPRTRTT